MHFFKRILIFCLHYEFKGIACSYLGETLFEKQKKEPGVVSFHDICHLTRNEYTLPISWCRVSEIRSTLQQQELKCTPHRYSPRKKARLPELGRGSVAISPTKCLDT